MSLKIDLNCDMGEGLDTDALIMPFISSANIACGSHAGDEDTMKKTIALALQHNVAIGAHPSYPDRKNFGRKEMSLSPDNIRSLVAEQIHLLVSIANTMGASVHHVKPHGALYNRAAADAETAIAIANGVRDVNPELLLFGLSGSISTTTAISVGLKCCHEVFADRTYTDEGMLTPRSEPNALISDETEAILQVLQMVKRGSVISTSGKTITVKADTICLHGDGAHAVAFAKSINRALTENLITITACK